MSPNLLFVYIPVFGIVLPLACKSDESAQLGLNGRNNSRNAPHFPSSIDRFHLSARKHSCHSSRYKQAGPGLSHLTQAHIIRERTKERFHLLSRIIWQSR